MYQNVLEVYRTDASKVQASALLVVAVAAVTATVSQGKLYQDLQWKARVRSLQSARRSGGRHREGGKRVVMW